MFLIKYTPISAKELKRLIDEKKQSFAIIDVRDEYEAKISSIAGSKLMPLKSIQSGEAIEYLRELASKKKLYLHCKSGNRSAKALIILEKYHIKGVNLEGGIDAWNKEIRSKENPFEDYFLTQVKVTNFEEATEGGKDRVLLV